jgi:hypothetical protein
MHVLSYIMTEVLSYSDDERLRITSQRMSNYENVHMSYTYVRQRKNNDIVISLNIHTKNKWIKKNFRHIIHPPFHT